ncbi:hypothetical protein C4J88_0315 [Pseudomonas sp. R4-39-08]|nr:hypothetical protein C4J90_0316 [Pseudomonas sp. R2-60-08W]AZF35129.1 hypothetical protein C4J88_0315 [Pseudomonas sp. R4-39-08]
MQTLRFFAVAVFFAQCHCMKTCASSTQKKAIKLTFYRSSRKHKTKTSK